MGIRPHDFWQMSLPEWRALIAGFQARRGPRTLPLPRAAFEEMMERYPDG